MSDEVIRRIRIALQEYNSNNEAILQAILKEVKRIHLGLLDESMGNKISYTLREAAPITGLSQATLYNYYKMGRLPGSQVAGRGGAILILREDLVAFISSRKDASFAFHAHPGDRTKDKKRL